MTRPAEKTLPVSAGPIRIWDLPTRLFHWALALLVGFSFVSAKVGGDWIEWHFRSGYAILTLIVFRLLWGVAGSRYARFATFRCSPRAIASYLRGGVAVAGHNPLGALAVIVMLLSLLVQGTTGLFATDDIASEGPLMKLVSNSAAALLTRVHRWNEKVLIALTVLHLAAVLYYLFVRRRNLIVPMLTGTQHVDGAREARDDAVMRVRAAVLLTVAIALVAYVVNV
jgi:cytochrome b